MEASSERDEWRLRAVKAEQHARDVFAVSFFAFFAVLFGSIWCNSRRQKDLAHTLDDEVLTQLNPPQGRVALDMQAS